MAEAILDEGSFRDYLGLKPEPAAPILGLDLGICLNITDGGPKGKWIKVRSVETMLRVEAQKLEQPVLSLLADRLCEWANISPASSLASRTGR